MNLKLRNCIWMLHVAYAATLFIVSIAVDAQTSSPDQAAKRSRVQIAILLDTSGSMSGLIEQTKGQLWTIVNQFIQSKQNGRRPELEVALFEYGKNNLSATDGYVRMIQPLTTDLDKISEELFALRTDGGEEYCGWVIKDATEKLAWSRSPEDFKAIFIAGNEPFTQGPVSYAQACKAAIEKGILVNTIHCGDEATGVASQWKHGALLAEGKYMFIDHNRAVVHFEAPQDQEIARLGVELNKTYVPFGAAGKESLGRQAVQDANSIALASQGSALNRALFKSSVQYCNVAWDLVDACKAGNVDLAKMTKDELPVEMQKMSTEERKAFVRAKTEERTKLQEKISHLNAERSKYVADKMKNQIQTQTNTLDTVMISAIREQALKKNFSFE
jgi:hypothetical protein